MFICQACKVTTEPGVKATKLVLAARETEYKDWKGRSISRGYETTLEVNVCPACVPKHEEKTGVKILPMFLRRDGDGRVRLNTETTT